ncbi:hypothetical protein [Thomasclavelia spiroformis]|uniref:hypothetical protein n=1 Tax=Thomasclavelia spiroformis TaxID=29348 RepID=UPI00242DAA0D|nr:hypothetical protein [Thomasclavelia spiroformis]
MNKFCPDLVGYEDVKSYAISSSWENARVPKLHPCIKDECAAYEKGYCHKWNTVIEPNKKSKYFNKSDQTLDFKHFKLYSENTLKNMNKDELIEYIHMLYHNWGASDERSKNIKNYADILHEKEVPKKPVYKKDYVGESNYFCSRCDSLMPFTLNRTAQIKYPFCPYCGQKLDWSDEE